MFSVCSLKNVESPGTDIIAPCDESSGRFSGEPLIANIPTDSARRRNASGFVSLLDLLVPLPALDLTGTLYSNHSVEAG